MLPLRYPRLWLIVGWFAIVLAVVGSLLPARDIAAVPMNDKIEHVTTYLLLTLWFAGIYPRARYVPIAGGLFILGISMEWAQGAMNLGRQRDIHDVFANTTGIAVGMGLALTLLGGWAQRVEGWLWPAKT
jgi:VanZ family protein